MYSHIYQTATSISTPSGFIDIGVLPVDPDWPDNEYPSSIGPGANAGDVTENFKVVQV